MHGTTHTAARWSASIAAVLCAAASLALTGCDSSNDPLFAGGPPAVPTGVFTITGDGQVEVRWNPVRGNSVEGYGVYRSDTTIDGAYNRLSSVFGEESTSYVDHAVVNGTTYFYAVDAFNFQRQESALSYEDAFDTPRPAGTGETLFASAVDPARAGLDWSSYDANFVRAFDDPQTDVFVQRIDGVLYAKGRPIGLYLNDLQDLGWTASLDDISWAPADGWSVSPNGVELIVGHTYVVWTHDEHFAKFRVRAIQVDGLLQPTSITFDWAYQIDPQNPELSPAFVARGEEPSGPRGAA
jgi:hypothetical protein